MVKKGRPRAGSLAFYPRKRAAKETPSFSSFPSLGKEGEPSKPLNFLAYKAGMTHVLGKDAHEKGTTFGHEVAVAATVLEAPPMRVFGIRAYGKAQKGFYGTVPLMDVFAENVDKVLLRKIASFKKKAKKKGSGKKEEKSKQEKAGKPEEKAMEKAEKPGNEQAQESKAKTFGDLEKAKEKILSVRLLCHSQPGKTKSGKKKPDVCEVALSGSKEQQLAFAKEKLGQEISILDVFSEKRFLDAKAVTKGKGMQGPVKRFGVKVQRPKAKKRRVVGSIGPWNPSTVMWTVARPGQMGYHTRTEYNKKILKIGSANELASVNPKGGFKNYGVLQNDFVLLAGSVAGPAKRAIGLRQPIRPHGKEVHKIESLDYVAGGTSKQGLVEEEIKAEHVVEKKEEKKEKKSVADEITAAVKGEEKMEKPKGK